jgi:hypothetical protein
LACLPGRDFIEQQVIDKITARGDVGQAKYGTTMDRKDLRPRDWALHLQEECLDAAQYAERVIMADNLLVNAYVIIREYTKVIPSAEGRHWLEQYAAQFETPTTDESPN